MNKTRILGIGIGQAGNILLNEFLNKDKRYVGLFINSAYDDMSDLSNFNFEKNAFVFPGESGTGRDRDKAKTFVKTHIKSLADIFTKYPLQDVITVFFSTDGGTGSGSAPMILQTLRKICPSKKINVVAVIPDADDSDDVSLNNCLKCCNELSKIEGLIDDIKFIDNSKGEDYKIINRKAIDDLNTAYSIIGKHSIGNIDDADSKRINTEKGYGMILRLDDDEESIRLAIDNAYKNTVFAKPDNDDCNYLGICVKENQYDVDKLRKQFHVDKTTYKTYNNKFNLLVLGGCSAPNETIEYIEMKLEEIKEKRSTQSSKKGLSVDLDSKPINKTNKHKDNIETKTSYSEDELDKMVDDLENLFS